MRMVFVVLLLGVASLSSVKSFADEPGKVSTVSNFKDGVSSELLLAAIPEAKEFKDKALTTYVARKLSRNYPFSPTAAQFLNAARLQSPEQFKTLKGGDFWFVPLTFLRVLVILSATLMLFRFEFRAFKTFLFSLLLTALVVGECLNLSRGLFATVFIPLEGEHFSFSAPESSSQAVEKLPSGTEIKVSEISGDWIKLELPSGRVGWATSNDGILESEEF